MNPGSGDPSPIPDDAAGNKMMKELLDPEVLTLHGKSITSDTASDEERYKLSHSVLSLPRETKDATDDERIDLRSTKGHHFFLVRPQLPKATDTWHLASKWPEEKESHRIVLWSHSPLKSTSQASKQEQFTAVLRADVHMTSSHEPDRDLLLTMQPRWLSTNEFNYLDGDGRQLACEERDGGGYKLVVTVEMSQGLRDAVVALWCLRVWRETVRREEKTKKDTYARRWA